MKRIWHLAKWLGSDDARLQFFVLFQVVIVVLQVATVILAVLCAVFGEN